MVLSAWRVARVERAEGESKFEGSKFEDSR